MKEQIPRQLQRSIGHRRVFDDDITTKQQATQQRCHQLLLVERRQLHLSVNFISMFRKATPTVVRHLRRAATTSSRLGGRVAAQRMASSSSVLSGSAYLGTSRFKSTMAAIEEPEVVAPIAEPPFKKILAANRGEIATRINRAGAELGVQTAGIYSYEGKKESMSWWCRLCGCSARSLEMMPMVTDFEKRFHGRGWIPLEEES